MTQNRALLLITCAAIAIITNSAAAKDVDFSQAVLNSADGNIVIETSPEDVLVFKDGIVNLEGKSLTIIADRLRAEGMTVVRSYDPEARPPTIMGTPAKAPKGAGGGSWGCKTVTLPNPTLLFGPRGGFKVKICNGDGQQGTTGSLGDMGTPGNPAQKIEIQGKSIEGNGKIAIIGNGQSGGQGQQGGQGGDGGRGRDGDNRGGNAFCSDATSPTNGGTGGRGGTGGQGGPGGTGGAGAEIVFPSALKGVAFVAETIDIDWLKTMSQEQVSNLATYRILAATPGGIGGPGGELGKAGDPDQGGNAGKSSHCGGGSDPGRAGGAGEGGLPGEGGASGVPGVIRFE
ncbi:hypothetical protein ACCS54_18930 [Rhizobium johnstonii]|uniref:hypothetical protein n=1 Tax=Rhizobium johnstonii TaxID=3019933 RepID=UPI003F990CD3